MKTLLTLAIAASLFGAVAPAHADSIFAGVVSKAGLFNDTVSAHRRNVVQYIAQQVENRATGWTQVKRCLLPARGDASCTNAKNETVLIISVRKTTKMTDGRISEVQGYCTNPDINETSANIIITSNCNIGDDNADITTEIRDITFLN